MLAALNGRAVFTQEDVQLLNWAVEILERAPHDVKADEFMAAVVAARVLLARLRGALVPEKP
jgi:hypothetical protein